MIEANMRNYSLLKLGEPDAYGDYTLQPDGDALISINLYAQNSTDNIHYCDAEYSGLTYDQRITERHLVVWGDRWLKVKKVNPFGRMWQLMMEEDHAAGKSRTE